MYSSVSLGSYFYLPIFVAVRNMKEEKIMTTMELEAYRAELARAILETEDWNLLDKVRRIVLPKSKKRAKAVEEEEPVMSDEEVREGLKEAFRCAKLIREGKLKGRPAREVLNEL